MKTSTITIEILAPIQAVWKALSTTEGMKAWLDWLKVETDWLQKRGNTGIQRRKNDFQRYY